MPKILNNEALLRTARERSARYGDGTPVRKYAPPKAVEPEPLPLPPPALPVVIREQGENMDRVVAAIRGLGAELHRGKELGTYEFVVTERDEFGHVLRFEVRT